MVRAKLRYEERLTLLESKRMDCCEERSQISDYIQILSDFETKIRHQNRMKDLDLEIGPLWSYYVSLLA
jgi:hypothetical protein